jgi:hypothetical protein
VAILIALSYCLIEHGDRILAGVNIRRALKIDPTSTSAHRCSAILTLTANIPQRGMPRRGEDKGKKIEGRIDILLEHSLSVMIASMDKKAISTTKKSFTQCLRYANGNPYSVRSCALQATSEGRYSDGLALMEAAAVSGSNHPLTLRALGMFIYFMYL